MMKYLLFSDLHIHAYKPFSSYEDGLNSRALWCLKALRRVLELAKTHEAIVIFLGDIFENRMLINSPYAKMLRDILAEFKDIKQIWVVGNHDTFGKSYNSEILSLFANGNIKVISSPEIEELEGFRLCFHPYPIEGYDKFHEWLEKIPEGDYAENT